MGICRNITKDQLILSIILILSGILRVAYVSSLDHRVESNWYMFSDEGADIARNLLAGRGYVTEYNERSLRSFRPPLYPLVLAAHWKLTGITLFGVRVMQALLGVITVLITYQLAKYLGGRSAGLVAASFAGIYPPLIYWSGWLGPECMVALLVSGAVLLARRIPAQPGVIRAAICGFALGLVGLARSMFLAFPIVVVVWILLYVRSRKTAIISAISLAVTFFLTLTPWLIRNRLVHNDWVLASTEGGLTFFMANNPVVLESLRTQKTRDWWFPAEYSETYQKARDLPEPEMNALYYSETFHFIKENPRLYIEAALQRPIRLWRLFPHITGEPDGLGRIHQIVMAATFGPLIILAFLGAKRLWKTHQAEVVLLIGSLVYITAVCMVIRAAIKYRAPFEPLLIAFAGTYIGLAPQRHVQRLLRLLDALLASFVLITGLLILGLPLIVFGRFRKSASPRRVLHLVNSSIDATRGRNGLYYYGPAGILGDLEGYFDRVFAVFHVTQHYREAQATDRCLLIDFHFDKVTVLESLRLHNVHMAFNELAYLIFVTRLIRRHSVGIIQVVDPYVSGLNGLVLSVLTGSSLSVLVMCDYDIHHRMLGGPTYKSLRSRRLEKLIERAVFWRSDLVVADRKYYASYATRNGARIEVVATVPMSVHPQFYGDLPTRNTARDELGLDGQLTMLYVGRFSPEKHVMDLLEVLCHLRDRGLPITLALAGNGPLKTELLESAGRRGVDEALTFLGSLELKRLRFAYRAADVVLGTHMGFTLLESALSACPMVAYDWEAHPEIILHGETGFLVPFGDSRAMADAAEELLRNQNKARRFGDAARSYALRHYGKGMNVDGLREAFHKLES